jgi:protein TonB
MERDKKKTKFIHQPEYPGGPKELTKFIYAHLRYPQAAFDAGVEGTVLVEYDIDYQGNVITTRVLHSLGMGCDEEASRVVRMLKFDVPKNRGVHVIFHQKARVQFKKPKPQPQPPTTPMQVSYTVSNAPEPAKPATSEAPKEGKTYTYTINL